MRIAISTETAADLTNELIEKYDLKVLPFNIQLGDRSLFDGEVSTDEIIEFVNQNKILPKTSAINEYQYNEHFENLLKDYDAIIHFSLSSKLSLACTNAIRAAKNYKNVYVVDSLSLSTGIALLAIYAKDLVDQGKSAQEIYDLCNSRVASVQASFELKRLDYLHKGGRCSSLALFGANVLRIRPQIIVKDGKMISGKKYRGNFAHVVKNYCHDVLEQFNTPDFSRVFITYTTADDDIVQFVKEFLTEKGFSQILVTRAGGTVTSHCGEDCLGILYINDGK